MNANELADALQETEPYYSTDYKLFDKAAAMLRQQAKELDEAGHMIGVLREQLQEEIQARADALDDLNSRTDAVYEVIQRNGI
jgi:methionine synthase II (cobalamin-independent)